MGKEYTETELFKAGLMRVIGAATVYRLAAQEGLATPGSLVAPEVRAVAAGLSAFRPDSVAIGAARPDEPI